MMPMSCQSDLRSALDGLCRVDAAHAPVHRCFVIGGATLYAESLAIPPTPSGTFVDRVLITRILSPAFDDCDVFMPAFEEAGNTWTRAAHGELRDWLGFEVPEGMQEEKGVRYEFQMWVRQA